MPKSKARKHVEMRLAQVNRRPLKIIKRITVPEQSLCGGHCDPAQADVRPRNAGARKAKGYNIVESTVEAAGVLPAKEQNEYLECTKWDWGGDAASDTGEPHS